MFTAVVMEDFGAHALRRNALQTAGFIPPGLALPNAPGYGFWLICHDHPFISASFALTALHVSLQLLRMSATCVAESPMSATL
jgi:hypothetical protein